MIKNMTIGAQAYLIFWLLLDRYDACLSCWFLDNAAAFMNMMFEGCK